MYIVFDHFGSCLFLIPRWEIPPLRSTTPEIDLGERRSFCASYMYWGACYLGRASPRFLLDHFLEPLLLAFALSCLSSEFTLALATAFEGLRLDFDLPRSFVNDNPTG